MLYICGIENNNTLCFYRASLDGAEFTTLVELMEIPSGFLLSNGWPGGGSPGDSGLIIHQGKAFVNYGLYNLNDDEDSLYRIVMIDLQSLKHGIIEERNRVHEFDWGMRNVKAVDGYLYYVLNNATLFTQEKSSIKRYSIKDKNTEEIVVLDKGSITNLAVINNELWYSYETLSNNTFQFCYIMIYDTISGETREFEVELFNTVSSERKNAFGDVYTDVHNENFGYSDIMYDGTYLFVSNTCFIGVPYYYNEPPEIYIYSLDGIRLTQFSHEIVGNYYNLSVLNGTVYFQTENLIDTCSVQDILNGNTVWKTEVLNEDLSSQ